MSIQITATGSVTKATNQNKLVRIKVEAPRTYFKDGQQVHTSSTYYVAVWFETEQTFIENQTITVMGDDAYRLSEPKEDGRIFIDRVISNARLYTAEMFSPSVEEMPF